MSTNRASWRSFFSLRTCFLLVLAAAILATATRQWLSRTVLESQRATFPNLYLVEVLGFAAAVSLLCCSGIHDRHFEKEISKASTQRVVLFLTGFVALTILANVAAFVLSKQQSEAIDWESELRVSLVDPLYEWGAVYRAMAGKTSCPPKPSIFRIICVFTLVVIIMLALCVVPRPQKIACNLCGTSFLSHPSDASDRLLFLPAKCRFASYVT